MPNDQQEQRIKMNADEALRAIWWELTHDHLNEETEEYPAHAPRVVLERFKRHEEEWQHSHERLRGRHGADRKRYHALAGPVRRALAMIRTGLEEADTIGTALRPFATKQADPCPGGCGCAATLCTCDQGSES